MNARPAKLDVYRTAIPMRGFEHAAAARDIAKAIVVRLELTDGRVGWGETLPRPYVTGETLDTVVSDLVELLWARYCESPDSPPGGAVEGRNVNAAACALELAHLDATKPFGDLTCGITARVSGVLGASDPGCTGRRLRLMRLFGLRDFKLKLGLGDDVDEANLRVVSGQIARAVAAGRCTLRVDVNGGWDPESTPQRVSAVRVHGVSLVEQPVFCPAVQFVELARRCELPLIADESLLTKEDALELATAPKHVAWNLRISKNGGLMATVELARLAGEKGVSWISGCMVGESGLLSGAQRRLLQLAPGARFVEGNYGWFLLGADLTRKSLRFGYGGRLARIRGSGMGASVDPAKLGRYGKLVTTLEGE